MIGVTNEGHLLHQPVNLQQVSSGGDLQQPLVEILNKIKDTLGDSASQASSVSLSSQSLQSSSNTATNNPSIAKKSKKPKVGDHIISHHVGHCYYTATVAEYNPSKMEYTVTWDDGDTSCRVQKYNQVCSGRCLKRRGNDSIASVIRK